ncbi:hypothetical protein [Nocardia brasiliensis]|uniref:hypothetical protein n=1 Tax=Nocardia brasiliensis TaxID=37326 RepID=UPI002458B7A1|nr:hypothetical protein [Nocardia brasiliensis]
MSDMDTPIYSRRDLKRIGYALLQVPHTGDIEFPGGQPPREPTPDVLVDMLRQLREILRAKMPALTEVEQLVWSKWNALSEDEPSPVKRIAKDLGMSPEDVAFIVYPAETFGRWDDRQEPDLDV